MKKMIVIFLICSSCFTWAKTTNLLECSNGEKNLESFSAILDYDPIYQNYNAHSASIIDNYASSANLVCEGRKISNIVCLGFWYNNSDFPFKVEILKKNNSLWAVYHTFENKIPGSNEQRPWLCSIK